MMNKVTASIMIPSPSFHTIHPLKQFNRWASVTDHHSPAVAYLLRKHHLSDPSTIPRTGKHNRLLKGDVLRYLQSRTLECTWILPHYTSLAELNIQVSKQWQPTIPVIFNHHPIPHPTSTMNHHPSPLKISFHSVAFIKKPSSLSIPLNSTSPLEPFYLSLLGIKPTSPTSTDISTTTCSTSEHKEKRDLFEELAGWPAPNDPRFLPILKLQLEVPSSLSESDLNQAKTEIMQILSATNYSSS